MGRGKAVTAPDGSHWLVRRRWLDRPLPNLRKRFQAGRDRDVEDEVVGGLWQFGVGDSWIEYALVAALLLAVFVLLPLLGVALELVALLFILCWGVFGRIVLGRPWIVEAVPRGGDGQPVGFPVKGWRRSGEVAGELAREIAATGRPESFEVPERG